MAVVNMRVPVAMVAERGRGGYSILILRIQQNYTKLVVSTVSSEQCRETFTHCTFQQMLAQNGWNFQRLFFLFLDGTAKQRETIIFEFQHSNHAYVSNRRLALLKDGFLRVFPLWFLKIFHSKSG